MQWKSAWLLRCSHTVGSSLNSVASQGTLPCLHCSIISDKNLTYFLVWQHSFLLSWAWSLPQCTFKLQDTGAMLQLVCLWRAIECLTVLIATGIRHLKNCFAHLSDSPHMGYWEKARIGVSGWIFRDGKPAFNKPPPSQNEWLVNIGAVQHKWMLKEASFKYLETLNLNEDPL